MTLVPQTAEGWASQGERRWGWTGQDEREGASGRAVRELELLGGEAPPGPADGPAPAAWRGYTRRSSFTQSVLAWS